MAISLTDDLSGFAKFLEQHSAIGESEEATLEGELAAYRRFQEAHAKFQSVLEESRGQSRRGETEVLNVDEMKARVRARLSQDVVTGA